MLDTCSFPSQAGSQVFFLFFNTVSGNPPCWVVLCLISCFSLKTTQSLPSLFFTFPSPYFLHFPTSPLTLHLSFLLCPFLISLPLHPPHLPFFPFCSALITCQTAFSCLPFYFSHLLTLPPPPPPQLMQSPSSLLFCVPMHHRDHPACTCR